MLRKLGRRQATLGIENEKHCQVAALLIGMVFPQPLVRYKYGVKGWPALHKQTCDMQQKEHKKNLKKKLKDAQALSSVST